MWLRLRFTGWLSVAAPSWLMRESRDKVESPLIETGKADVLVGFEVLGGCAGFADA